METKQYATNNQWINENIKYMVTNKNEKTKFLSANCTKETQYHVVVNELIKC